MKMKKWLTFILIIALLTVSVGAFAEEETQAPAQQEVMQTESADSQAQKKGRRNKQEHGKEQNDESDAATGATREPQDSSGRQTEDGQARENDRTDTPRGGKGMPGKENRKPRDQSASRNSHSTDKEQNRGDRQKPGKAQSSQKNSKEPADRQAAAAGPDLDALVKSGVIARETADRITAYMDEHQLAQSALPELLETLLDAQVITRAEYEAMLSALAATAV